MRGPVPVAVAATPSEQARGLASRQPTPLATVKVVDDVRAISGNAWFSLGRHGVGLHFRRLGRTSLVTVLKRGGRGKVWGAELDGRAMERFSTLEQAVEAADYEIDQMGSGHSARDEASWRMHAPPAELLAQLRSKANITTYADALRQAVWEATR